VYSEDLISLSCCCNSMWLLAHYQHNWCGAAVWECWFWTAKLRVLWCVFIFINLCVWLRHVVHT